MAQKKTTGRGILGATFLVGMGFLMGMYRVEINSFIANTVQSIRSK